MIICVNNTLIKGQRSRVIKCLINPLQNPNKADLATPLTRTYRRKRRATYARGDRAHGGATPFSRSFILGEGPPILPWFMVLLRR